MYQPENKSGTPLAPGKRGMPKGAAMGRADTSVTETDVMSDFFAGVMQLAAEAQQRLTGKRALRCGSEAMAVAVEAGLPQGAGQKDAEREVVRLFDRNILN